MSRKHPVVVVTGSSGTYTAPVKQAFENIFRREGIVAAEVLGDGLHKFGRAEFRRVIADAAKEGNHSFSHFGPEANHFEKIEETFKTYGETGTCKRRYYVHSEEDACLCNKRFNLTNLKPGEFSPWEDTEPNSDLLLYRGLHGMVKDGAVDPGRHVDFSIGLVPVVNLEWIQKIHRDKQERGYPAEETVDSILRRLPDYVKYITPQFSRTNINFHRIAMVDTSDPFIARDIPTLDESMMVIRFRYPKGVDFQHMLKMIPNSFMSRANTLVTPGGSMSLAMEIILAPILRSLMEGRNK